VVVSDAMRTIGWFDDGSYVAGMNDDGEAEFGALPENGDASVACVLGTLKCAAK